MNTKIFNFTRLKDIYLEALNQEDHTLIFDVGIGRGRFLFMMFFSDEDEESKDKLFILLRNTHQIIKCKLYGNHRLGDFKIYISESIQEKLIAELQLSSSGRPFNFDNFLHELNNGIPGRLLIEAKINLFRSNWNELKTLGLSEVVDENEKTILVGEMRLPASRKPREKTLRKLYVYTNGDPSDIAELIELLKSMNMTVAWTTLQNQRNATDIREIINRVR